MENTEHNLVSIIVPVYNVENYLPKCVDSLINQTYKNIEIILVDDGSTDNSGIICDRYQTLDERVTALHKNNGGLSDARNYGIERARGSYLSFVDSDDFLNSETIKKLLDASLRYDCDISVCNMIRFFDDNSEEVFYKPSSILKVLNGSNKYETLKQPSVCNKLFKKTLFDNIQFPYKKYYEDTFVYHELCYKANRIVLTGYDGYWYLSRKGSILGHEKLNDNYFDFIEAVWLRSKFLIENNVQPYGDQACLSLYASVANAVKEIPKSKDNAKRFDQVYYYYDYAYRNLIRTNITIKQKVRLILLKYLPWLHSKIY